MAKIGLLSNFRNRNASDFFTSVVNEENFLYVFIGRTAPWNDDEIVPDVQNTLLEENQIWTDINGIKRIQADDVTIAFRRIDWSPNRIFDEYDDGENLSTKDFYAITDENKVYKCISNNNRSRSTVKPIHTTFDISSESDGYKWKYMFSISESLLEKFIAPEFAPLEIDEDVIEFAEPGTIDNVKVEEPGSGYRSVASIDSNTEIPVFIEGNGDQTASAEALLSTSDGRVLTASILDGGTDYPYAPESRIPIALRQITDAGISQSAYGIAATNALGQIDDLELIIGGENYSNGVAKIVQSSCRAFAETNFEGEIINAEVFQGRAGSNFTEATAVVVSETNGEPAKLRPQISPLEGHGANPQKEVFAKFVMINLRLSGDESFIDLNDFRRIGIIEDPHAFGEEENLESDGQPKKFDGIIGDTRYRIDLNTSNDGFQINEVLYGESTGARGNELTKLNDNTVRVIIDESIARDIEFEVGETVRGLSSGEVSTIANIIPPDIEPYSGTILYINNSEPVVRELDLQLETVTLVIEY
jgi:hypothetical protein